MKIYVFATGGFKGLAERFLANGIESDAELILVGTEINKTLPGKTDDDDYLSLIADRVKYNKKVVKNNQGEVVLFLDADIVILDRFVEDLNHILSSCDYAFQSSHGTVEGFNGGIQAVNCNSRSLRFFEKLDKRIALEGIDKSDPEKHWRDTLSEMSKAGDLNICPLPPDYGFLNSKTKMYHAINGGTTLEQKTIVLSLVNQIRNNEEIFPAFYSELFRSGGSYRQLYSLAIAALRGRFANKAFFHAPNFSNYQKGEVEVYFPYPSMANAVRQINPSQDIADLTGWVDMVNLEAALENSVPSVTARDTLSFTNIDISKLPRSEFPAGTGIEYVFAMIPADSHSTEDIATQGKKNGVWFYDWSNKALVASRSS